MNVFQYLDALDALDAACNAGLITGANLSQGVHNLSAAYETQSDADKTCPVNSPARIVAAVAAAAPAVVRPVYSNCPACNGNGISANDNGTVCPGCLGSGGQVAQAWPICNSTNKQATE